MAGGTNPGSSVNDTVVANTCYQYRYVLTDNLTNTTTVTSSSVVKVIPSYATAVAATTGLVNWWRLTEATGTTATDTKSGNNGTYTGAPTQGVAGAIAGDTNGAVQLDGTDDTWR